MEHPVIQGAFAPEGRAGAEQVRTAVVNIIRSERFNRSRRLCDLLWYLAEETLAGRAARLKEYTIAIDVFGRGAEFDPKIDTAVRTEAWRLRARLRDYYRAEGACDWLRINFRKGSFVPEFNVGASASHAAPMTPAHEGFGHLLRDQFLYAYLRNAVAVTPLGEQIRAGLNGMISGHTDLAIAHLRQQLVLRPEDALLHTMLGLSLLQAGLLPEALSEAICGAELDPRCAFATSSVAVVHYHMRHYDDALYHSHRAEAQSPEFDAVKLLIGDIYLHSGFHRAAIGRLEDACRLTANHPLALAHLGYGYARTGRYGEARRLLGALQGGAAGNAALLALVNAGLGESDAALGHLEQALESRTHMPELLLHSSPAYDGLRAHPRFPALLASLG